MGGPNVACAYVLIQSGYPEPNAFAMPCRVLEEILFQNRASKALYPGRTLGFNFLHA